MTLRLDSGRVTIGTGRVVATPGRKLPDLALCPVIEVLTGDPTSVLEWRD